MRFFLCSVSLFVSDLLLLLLPRLPDSNELDLPKIVDYSWYLCVLYVLQHELLCCFFVLFLRYARGAHLCCVREIFPANSDCIRKKKRQRRTETTTDIRMCDELHWLSSCVVPKPTKEIKKKLKQTTKNWRRLTKMSSLSWIHPAIETLSAFIHLFDCCWQLCSALAYTQTDAQTHGHAGFSQCIHIFFFLSRRVLALFLSPLFIRYEGACRESKDHPHSTRQRGCE